MKLIVPSAFLFLSAFLTASQVFAYNYFTWNGTYDNWQNPNNWDVGGGVPGDTDINVGFGPQGASNTVVTLYNFNPVINELQFLGGAPAYTIGTSSSEKLTLKNGVVRTGWGLLGDQTIKATIILGPEGGSGESTILNGDINKHKLILAGGLVGASGGTRNIRFWSAVGAPIEVSGFISNGSGGALSILVTYYTTLTISGGGSDFTGGTTVEQKSTLALGRSDVLPNAGAFKLFDSTLSTGGFDETLGTLSLSSDAKIDFGLGDSDIAFADSSKMSWSGTLSLLNFDIGVDSLRFGVNDHALTSLQLSRIKLPGYTASLDPAGYLKFADIASQAIPEPQSLLFAGLAAFGFLVFYRRRAAA